MSKLIGCAVVMTMVFGVVMTAMAVDNAAPPPPMPGMGAAQRPGGPGGPGPGNPREMIERVFRTALRNEVARNDAQTQQLVDKALADRKTALASDTARVTALEKLVVACRSGDREAMQAAEQDFKAAVQKAAADDKLVFDDVRALGERLRAILPPPGTMQGDGQRPPLKGGAENKDAPPAY